MSGAGSCKLLFLISWGSLLEGPQANYAFPMFRLSGKVAQKSRSMDLGYQATYAYSTVENAANRRRSVVRFARHADTRMNAKVA